MLDGLKALIALERTGTIGQAAVELRLTQSAVSKRIQALEAELGYNCVKPDGRRLALTTLGKSLAIKARPILLEIESLHELVEPKPPRSHTLAISDSIGSSWGPKLIKKSLAQVKSGLELELHVHRSTLILEQLRIGKYELGIVTGEPQGRDLSWDQIAQEPMVLIGRKSTTSPYQNTVLTIEMNSVTWRSLARLISNHPRLHGKDFVFVESFSAAAQMARQDFGSALVPEGIARSLGFKSHEFSNLSPQIKRTIHFVCRKSLRQSESVGQLVQALIQQADQIVSG